MRFLLALVVSALCTPIELQPLHHQGDEWLDKHPYLFRLEHERDHRVRSELCAHCPTDSLPFGAPPGTDKECVLCIFHKGSAVATRIIVSFLEALQVRIKATMARKRLRQVKADLTVLSIQPSVELRDHTVCPSPRLVTMPSRLPFLDESVPPPPRERFPAAQRSSTQFGILRQFSAPHLSVPRTASSG